MFIGRYLLLMLILPSLSFAEVVEEELPLWELGVGVGGVTLPQYMGSDERYLLPFVYPYIIYRGEKWRIDPTGIKNKVVDTEHFDLELSLSGGLPVRNDNQARLGMPELKLTGEVGAKLNWYLSESEEESWIVRLPARAVIDIGGNYLGWVADPVLTRRHYYPVEHGLLKTYVDVGVQYNSTQYHQNYYGVEPQYATTNRAAYEAKGGLHSIFAKMWVRYPWDKDTELFTTLQFRSLASGVVSDSPLVKNNIYMTMTLGVVWIFSTSNEMVLWR